MVLPCLGKWCEKGGLFLRWKRIYRRGYKWTPLCIVSWRYDKRLEPAGDEFRYYRGDSPNGGIMVDHVRGISTKKGKWLGATVTVGIVISLLFILMKAYQLIWAPEPIVTYQVTYRNPVGQEQVYKLRPDQIHIRNDGWVEIEPENHRHILLRGDVLVIVETVDCGDK